MNKTMLKILAGSIIGASLFSGCSTKGGSGVVAGDGK
jgi:hypothetical protein